MSKNTGTETRNADDMPKPLPNDLEALKLLGDWSKWCIAIESAAITAIGIYMKPEVMKSLGVWPRVSLSITVVAFFVSILAAAGLLLSIPATAQRLPPKHPDDVFLMGTYEGTRGIRVFVAVHVQTWSFIVGLASFIALLLLACWSFPLPRY